jgi:aspartate/methionine/tyrosine aminotransferase
MTAAQRVMGSEYMNWAKTCSGARFSLTNSGLANLKLHELSVSLDELEITTDTGYGYPPLVQALADRMGVGSEAIVTAAGTSFANHLAMASLINPGDEVLIEHPTYEPLLSLARYLGAEVKRFPRLFNERFRISPDRIKQCISSRTRLIVITNLNNPSGVRTDDATLAELGRIAGAIGSRVLVDEVYLEAFFDQRPPNAYLLGPEFIVTSSLTKAFGLSGLRCGWIVADPDLAKRMWLLNDLFASTPVHAAERMSVVALQQLNEISRKAERQLSTNRSLVTQFLNSRDDLDFVEPDGGTVFFPRLRAGDADSFCNLLRDKYETTVVPGRFFEMPDHFRIGIGSDTETLTAGLERLDQALSDYAEGKLNAL